MIQSAETNVPGKQNVGQFILFAVSIPGRKSFGRSQRKIAREHCCTFDGAKGKIKTEKKFMPCRHAPVEACNKLYRHCNLLLLLSINWTAIKNFCLYKIYGNN
jgi:hypothetical protein